MLRHIWNPLNGANIVYRRCFIYAIFFSAGAKSRIFLVYVRDDELANLSMFVCVINCKAPVKP